MMNLGVRSFFFAGAALVAAAAVVLACSSSDSSSGGAATGGDGGASSGTPPSQSGGSALSHLCKAYVDHDVKCDPDAETKGQPSCETDPEYLCLVAVARPGTIDQTYDCLASRECGTPDEACPYQVGSSYGPFATFSTSCLQKHDACPKGEGFQDDYCAQYTAIMNDTVLSAMTACLEKPCGEIQDCFGAALRDADPACKDLDR
jgi:hypothetical protein